MAQGRLLSKASSEDEALNRCSMEAHLLYVQSIPHLDRDGLITGRPLLLWRLALPLRVDFIDITGRLIDEWVQHGLVVRYAGKDGPVLFFKGFRRYNANIHYAEERPSTFPPPPGWVRTKVGLMPKDPEQRLMLAEDFDPRSSYRKALLGEQADGEAVQEGVSGKSDSRPTREKVVRNSRVAHEELAYQDQSEDQDQSAGGGDHSITPTRVEGGEGPGRGGLWADASPPVDEPAGPTHLLEFSDGTLRRTACEIGPMVFGSDFRGYGRYVAIADADTLMRLLEWIIYFWERYERCEGIRDLPAYVRSCVSNGDRPGLTTMERNKLIELILQVQAL